MAKYTIELRKVCDLYGREEVENWFSSYNLKDFLTNEQINVLNFEGVWTKEKLAKKIVDHYFMREIGFETPYLFRHYAITTMNEIMEEYLLKIYTKFLEYDPLSSVDYVEEYTRKIENSNSSNGQSHTLSSNTGESYSIANDTPQTNITKQNLENGAYASSTTQTENENSIEDNTTNETSGNSNTLEKYTHTMKGDNGVIVTNEYLVREFRDLAKSFNLEIIEKLNTLFMGIY